MEILHLKGALSILCLPPVYLMMILIRLWCTSQILRHLRKLHLHLVLPIILEFQNDIHDRSDKHKVRSGRRPEKVCHPSAFQERVSDSYVDHPVFVSAVRKRKPRKHCKGKGKTASNPYTKSAFVWSDDDDFHDHV